MHLCMSMHARRCHCWDEAQAAHDNTAQDAAKAAAAAAPPAPTPRAKPAASGGSSRALAPPPMFAAPRPGAPVQAAPAASYHADSQATQVGQARVSLERLQSDASTTGGGRGAQPHFPGRSVHLLATSTDSSSSVAYDEMPTWALCPCSNEAGSAQQRRAGACGPAARIL